MGIQTTRCKVCGKEFTRNKFANKRQIYCTLKCRSKEYCKKYYVHFVWKKERTCPVCGNVFIPIRVNMINCSSKCTKKKWKISHKEKYLEGGRIYNAKRKLDPIKRQKDLEAHKRWRLVNKDKKYSYKRAYRARKYGNGGRHTKVEWEAIKYAYDYTCLWCGKKEPEIKLTEDHFIPLTKGGDDSIENIQPLCKPCNSLKNDRLVSNFPQT
jgi:5-methylcytosine-specific restriction endonuclease McrA